MPVLRNPRHEAFAQAIFNGIVGAKGGATSQAPRLLTFANGIGERIEELQAQAAEHSVADKCVQELNELRREARADKAYGAAVSAVMGKAKILNLTLDQPRNTSVDYSSANSMQDIGRRLLQSVGFASPDDASIQAAVEANDAFVGRLEAIRAAAQGLTIEQDD